MKIGVNNNKIDTGRAGVRIVNFLRNIAPASEFQCRIVDPIARSYGEETLAQSIGRALSQGVNRDRLQKEIDELEAMADAIERGAGN